MISFDELDNRLTQCAASTGIPFLRVSLGVIFFWFGALKFFPGFSPAESLATETIRVMTFGAIEPDVSIILLALWETLIGIGLITGKALRAILLLLFLQMPGTITPMFFFPDLTFQHIPFILTIEGQYIVKNLVLVAAGIVIGATVRGGRLTADRKSTDG